MAKTIGKLITTGYLTREQNPADKRAYNIYPTDKSRKIYPQLVNDGTSCMKILTDGLSESEKETLSYLLEKIAYNAKSMTDKN